jgi:hypothetical protein
MQWFLLRLREIPLGSVDEADYSAIMWGFSELRRSTRARLPYGLLCVTSHILPQNYILLFSTVYLISANQTIENLR